jgi:predicted GNAT superfamily acetyltransferase
MSIAIRDVREHELDSVLALNNAAGSAILPLDAARVRRFHAEAEYFRIAERDGAMAGFLIGFGSDARHDSDNFRWFRERHPSFFYIDRIVVASRRRGGGVGRAFYADVQSYAELRYPQLACEVFLEQDSDPALLFHGSFGFREIGQHLMQVNGADGNSTRRAAMLMKELCSFQWVRDTYGGQLPHEAWVPMPRVNATAAQHRATGT